MKRFWNFEKVFVKKKFTEMLRKKGYQIWYDENMIYLDHFEKNEKQISTKQTKKNYIVHIGH